MATDRVLRSALRALPPRPSLTLQKLTSRSLTLQAPPLVPLCALVAGEKGSTSGLSGLITLPAAELAVADDPSDEVEG